MELEELQMELPVEQVSRPEVTEVQILAAVAVGDRTHLALAVVAALA